MPWFLRIGFRPERWLDPTWLPGTPEVQADAVIDFKSIQNNELSVFLVNSDEECIRGAIAIASKREQKEAFGYAIFDVNATMALGIHPVPSRGDTPDPQVNEWHRELRELTFAQLSELARLIRQGRVEDIPLPTFKRRVRQAIDAGQFDQRQVHNRNLA
jgi:hypothetical protein